MQGVKAHPWNFDVIKIPWNPGKICRNLSKMCEPLHNRCMCFDFAKMAPKIKVQTFFWGESSFYLVLFGQVRGILCKFGGNLGKNGAWSALIWKMHLTWNAVVYFLVVIFLECFSGKFRKIWAKVLRIPKFWPAPTPKLPRMPNSSNLKFNSCWRPT